MPPKGFFDDDGDENSNTENSSGLEHAAAIAGESPEVQQHAVEAALKREEETAPQNPPGDPAKVDDFGTPFDPTKHTGSKLKSGKWREKKSTLAAPRAPTKSTKEITDAATNENNARAAGAVAAQMIAGSCVMFMGAEWQFRKKADAGFDEQQFMSEAFGNYFIAKGVIDIPPGAALAMALVGYFGARTQMPETKSRISRFKTWLAIRWTARKLRKEFAKRNIAARVEIKDGVLMVDGKRHEGG